jgi:hypothetical protein
VPERPIGPVSKGCRPIFHLPPKTQDRVFDMNDLAAKKTTLATCQQYQALLAV